ncbi:MAG: class I SAM-dependent RNA methyltransferase [Lachnospiraceae bacterium]|nr:class I SAM-dependent RNA methyltransferase [Lachnospiraceae bacterium]
MQQFELIAPCHFGLESVLKREIYDLGYDTTRVEDGRVFFAGDAESICRANIHLRTPQRILLNLGEFHAATFDELFEETRKIPWEEILPDDAVCNVAKATSVKSKLFSTRDIQSIVKKAVARRMCEARGLERLPETGDSYPLRIFLYKDQVIVGLDTSGESLHRRGYRLKTGKAPIEETLAAALLMLTPWKPGRFLLDPFCGSGTFVIEAAMMAADIAPGLNREFVSCDWTHLIPSEIWKDSYDEARELAETADPERGLILGSDIDGKILSVAKENAKRAGVAHLIRFEKMPVAKMHRDEEYGFIVTNPPYGERLMHTTGGETDAKEVLASVYRDFGKAFADMPTWSAYMITSYEQAERMIGKSAQKKRKIYNGMLRTDFYQFPGPKPNKNKRG